MKIDATKVILIGVLVSSVGLSGCAKWKARRAERRAARNAEVAERSKPIILDGQFNDWPKNAATVADGQSIYFRVTVANDSQGPSDQVALWLDVDNSATTGFTGMAQAPGMGIDLIIDHVGSSGGPVAYAVGADGSRTPLTAEEIGLQSVQHPGAQAWELRISRKINAASAPILTGLLLTSGTGVDMFIMEDSAGSVVGWSDPESFEKPVALAAK